MAGEGDAAAEPVSVGSASVDESAVVAEADEALLSRLALIGERPLADRAAAFGHLHDELRAELEATDAGPLGGDSPRTT